MAVREWWERVSQFSTQQQTSEQNTASISLSCTLTGFNEPKGCLVWTVVVINNDPVLRQVPDLDVGQRQRGRVLEHGLPVFVRAAVWRRGDVQPAVLSGSAGRRSQRRGSVVPGEPWLRLRSRVDGQCCRLTNDSSNHVTIHSQHRRVCYTSHVQLQLHR